MKKIMGTILVIAALGLLATTAVGHRWGADCGRCPDQMSRSDHKAATAIEEKYAAEYAALDKKMAAKRDEIRAARRNDAMTMGEFNKLREQMFELRREYRLLDEKVRQELFTELGETDDGGFYCDGPRRWGGRGPQGDWRGFRGMRSPAYGPGPCGNCPDY